MRRTVGLTVLLLISMSSHAMGDLESECHKGGKHNMLKGEHIKEYFISTTISETNYGFKIKVNDEWYKTILKENEEQGYRDQFSSTARIAKILHLPVNVCVDKVNGYLLGIELF
ncbi:MULTISPECIES: hypothetical protein [unclassified Symbiopectobacterium]|uniref:hypothetical protein n=1 Tax=unclassified Symbiopectobacterium TaxID=2794573 RepID=UPI0022273DF4|nr:MULTISPECIES: hypothetical protein [unclassified Symbiopectobacterium]MCW2475567.1 hypothetical protein [Candidatus Symbiopectobacterium sp. NZEC151]MCW2482674.1 hypothetical protein [Candidatus Symbiopectobacterium sp. NZEC135]